VVAPVLAVLVKASTEGLRLLVPVSAAIAVQLDTHLALVSVSKELAVAVSMVPAALAADVVAVAVGPVFEAQLESRQTEAFAVGAASGTARRLQTDHSA